MPDLVTTFALLPYLIYNTSVLLVLTFFGSGLSRLGNGFYYLGFGFCNYKYTKLKYVRDSQRLYIDQKACVYCSGAVMLASVLNLRTIWPTYLSFIPYFEDVELGIRGLQANLQSSVVENAIAFHKYRFEKKGQLHQLNFGRYIMLFSYYPVIAIMALIPALLFFEIALFCLVPSLWLEKLSVYRDLIRRSTWKTISVRRKHNHTKGFQRIAAYFSSNIDIIDLKSPLLQKIADGPLRLYWDFVKRRLFNAYE